jgi:hypothetical protein
MVRSPIACGETRRDQRRLGTPTGQGGKALSNIEASEESAALNLDVLIERNPDPLPGCRRLLG